MTTDKNINELTERLKRPNVQTGDVEEAIKFGLRSGNKGEEFLARLANLNYGKPLHELEVGTECLNEEIKELEEKLTTRRRLKSMYDNALGFNPEGIVYGINNYYGDDLGDIVTKCRVPIEIASDTSIPGTLASATEEAYWRIQNPNTDFSSQWTRTWCAYFRDTFLKKDGLFYMAFGDSMNPKENIVLARPGAVINPTKSTKSCTIPKLDKHIRIMLDCAYGEGRVVPVPHGSPEESSIGGHEERVATTDFGNHLITKAIWQNLAEKYGQWLNQRGRRSINISTKSAFELEKLGLPDEHVRLYDVSLGGSRDGSIVITSRYWAANARAVARETRV